MGSSVELFSRYKKYSDILIETGTYTGDGVECAFNSGYTTVYSCDINPEYVSNAKEKFKNKNFIVELIPSEIALKKFLTEIDQRCVIFLDGHAMPYDINDPNKGFGPDTLEENALTSPLIEELKIIKEHHIKENELRIGSNHVGISYILPKYIKEFQDRYPETKFYIHNLSKENTDKKLLHNDIDIAIYPTTVQSMDFDFKPIRTHRPILLLNRDDPLLQKQEEVKMEDIQGRHLVRIDPKLITLPNFEQVIKYYNLQTSITFENADWEILKQFVRAKIGVALISDICYYENDPDLVAIPMTQYFGEMIYSLYTRKVIQQRNIVKKFLDIIYKT